MPQQSVRPNASNASPLALDPAAQTARTADPRAGLRSLDYQSGARSLAPAAKPGAGAADDVAAPTPNDILFAHETKGASRTTAKGQGVGGSGVAASEAMAEQDRTRLDAMGPIFLEVAAKYNLPPALLAAIASRETRAGKQLDKNGYSIWDGAGFGVMQVDKGSHTPKGSAKGKEHITQAASILAGYRDQVAKKFPDWTPDQVLQGAVYAYNAGPSRVKSFEGLDKVSPGKDYSSDAWARARYLAPSFGGAPQQSPAKP